MSRTAVRASAQTKRGSARSVGKEQRGERPISASPERTFGLARKSGVGTDHLVNRLDWEARVFRSSLGQELGCSRVLTEILNVLVGSAP